MFATATLTELEPQPRVAAEAQAAISICEPLAPPSTRPLAPMSTTCPAGRSTPISGSPSRRPIWNEPRRCARLPGPDRLPCRRAGPSGALGRLGRRDLQPGHGDRAQAATWPSAQERVRGMTTIDRRRVSYWIDLGAASSPLRSAGGAELAVHAANRHFRQSEFHSTDLHRSTQMYSMYEALARERMREQQELARAARLSQRLASARLWRRLAAYSARRAARSRRRWPSTRRRTTSSRLSRRRAR